MQRTKLFAANICIGVLSASVSTALGQWAADGAPISTAAGNQGAVAITADGSGGAIAAWNDLGDIRAQRVDIDGQMLWSTDGIVVCAASNIQDDPALVYDGAGGAIVVWCDKRAPEWDIYAQRVNASGTWVWEINGLPISTATSYQYQHVVASDDSGGVIVAWSDGRNGNYDIYAQRADAAGVIRWTANGELMCVAANDRLEPTIVSDGAGGAVVAWEDRRAFPDYDIYAQRVDASGVVQWAPGGVPVCTEPAQQRYPRIASDGAGGAIITWWDLRGGDHDVYAQRVDAGGNIRWTSNGVVINDAAYDQTDPRIVADEAGGAIIAWRDQRNGSPDLFAQRVDSLGALLWATVGEPLCSAAGSVYKPSMVPDGSGGAVVVWYDDRSGSDDDIYAQLVDADGNASWAVDGVAVCSLSYDQNDPVIATDGNGGALVAWLDRRGGIEYDVYSQGLDNNGDWGYPTPSIHSVRDVPLDQGGAVGLAWDASRRDPNPNGDITHYTIWRALDSAQAARSIDNGAAVFAAGDGTALREHGGVIRIETSAGGTYYWELIDSQTAYHLDAYSIVVPTLFDSTASGIEYHYFQVIAHTSDPYAFYPSAPDSGYSVDNLGPAVPQGLAGEQTITPDGLQIHWLPNTEEDLAGYYVYRGTAPDFVPSDGNRIAATPDTTSFDAEWLWSSGYYYKVSAVDIHGNESPFAVLGPDLVVAAGEPAARTFLAQNVPNPFNPTTAIAFGLDKRARVTVAIYDASGRAVRTLVDREMDAGRHEAVWDGRDRSGTPVATGVYFYEMNAGERRFTKKMLLLK